MTRPGSSIIRSAFTAMNMRLIVLQIGLGILVFLLSVVWLRLPDSSALSVIATVVLGLLLLAIASGGEIALMLQLCNSPQAMRKILRGSVALLLCVAVWFLWNWLISAFLTQESLLAGYLNSRFPASLRTTFSYAHLSQGMEWLAALLRWIGAGILIAVTYSITASARPYSALRRILCSVTFWIVLIVGCFAALEFTSLLMDWTPGHSLSVEMLSLLLRLAIVTVVDASIALFVLAVVSAWIQRSDSTYEIEGGGPDGSQPTTVVAP